MEETLRYADMPAHLSLWCACPLYFANARSQHVIQYDAMQVVNIWWCEAIPCLISPDVAAGRRD